VWRRRAGSSGRAPANRGGHDVSVSELPELMRAIVFEAHGGPEVLGLREVPTPHPGPGEVVFEVRALALNYVDTWARMGLPGVRTIFPHISGSEASGVVAAVGAGVTELRPGDEVITHSTLTCRRCEACWSGHESRCRSLRVWGYETGPLDGAMGQFARLPEMNLVRKPANLTFEEAAAYPLVLMTAWHMLVTRAALQAGEDVLVWGAAGGLGVYALQVCRFLGARAIAVVGGGGRKADLARELGATEVIDHRSEDVVARVRELTQRKGVEVVFEHTGAATWERSIHSLARGGRLVTSGATSGWEAATDLRYVFSRELSLLGAHEASRAELLAVTRLVEAGRIRPVVREVFPLEEAAEAERRFVSPEKVGKIVLVPERRSA